MDQKEKEFVEAITKEWSAVIEAIEVDGHTRPIEKVKTTIYHEECILGFLLEDLCKDDGFVPIDEHTKKTYRKWGSKAIEYFEPLLGEKEDTVPNSSFTEFTFRSGWGTALDYGVWRLSISFNVKGMMAKHRERKIDNLLGE